MRTLSLVVPGRINQRTGGYIYDRHMADGLHRCGWHVDVIELLDDFPKPTHATLEDASRALARIPSGAIVMIDSLALGAMPDIIEREAPRLGIVALVHLPLAAAAQLAGDPALDTAQAEGRALHCAVRVIATGKAALPLLAPYAIPADRIVVVEPGTDRAPLARGSRESPYATGPLELLCVASVTSGKGHEVLLEALVAVPHSGWRLTCAGSLTRDPATVARVRATIARLGLDDRVSLVGELGDAALDASFARADIFALATRQETYGMAVAEALARGIPVVSTETGAIADLLKDEAGLVVPVNDPVALTSALARIIGDPDLRGRLSAGARRVRHRLPTWEDAVTRMAEALDPLAHG